jgi:serine phosphatase RsbU (regulator of sigma subunit)
MAMARSLLRGQIASGRDPGEVLARTNGAMFDDLANAGLFITMFCAGFDPRTRELQFANAGHNPPLLRRASGTVEALDADGAAIGLLPDLEFEQRATTLTAGDLLVLYTDGVVEAGIAAGDGFGERRLRQLVRDCGGDAPPAELAQLVYGAVARHAGPAARDDDVTLAVLRAQ